MSLPPFLPLAHPLVPTVGRKIGFLNIDDNPVYVKAWKVVTFLSLNIAFTFCLIWSFVPSPSRHLSLNSLSLGTIGAQHLQFRSQPHAYHQRCYSHRHHYHPHHQAIFILKCILVHDATEKRALLDLVI